MEEDDTHEQPNNRRSSNDRPWLFKKGQSGNPGGRPVGSKSLKQRAKEYLEGLSDEEAQTYFDGLNKLDVWKMAEGMPMQKNDLGVTGNITVNVIKYDETNNDSPQPTAK